MKNTLLPPSQELEIPSTQLPASGMSYRIMYTLIMILLVTISCKKEPDDPIPNPSYFDDMSATINGQTWKASCTPSWPGMGCTKVDCQYYEDTKGFEISAGGNNTYGVRFSKNGGGGIIIGENILPKQTSNLTCAIINCVNDQCRQYNLDTSFINVLRIIQIDKSTKLIEGSFNLRVVNSQCNDTIMIENGYFKTIYRP